MSKIKSALMDAEDFYARLQRASEAKGGMTDDQRAHFEAEYLLLKLKLEGYGLQKAPTESIPEDGC